MNNPSGNQPNRDEIVAFLVVGDVLGVHVEHADAGGGDGQPDGRWVSAAPVRTGILEVTSPQSGTVVDDHKKAERAGKRYEVSADHPSLLGELDGYVATLFEDPHIVRKIEKLRRQEADERHLYLLERRWGPDEYFYRLSDRAADGKQEPLATPDLPSGISAVWFQGRAARVPHGTSLNIARLDSAGWSRHSVVLPPQ